MPKMTLLIIDMLNDFFRQHTNLAKQRSQLVTAINTLTKSFRDHDQSVLWVRQEFAPICMTHSWICESTTCM
jgi:nicotinamidase-related amidase